MIMYDLHGTCVKMSITEIHLSDVSVVVSSFILLLPNEGYENGDTHTFHSQFDVKSLSTMRCVALPTSVSNCQRALHVSEKAQAFSQFFLTISNFYTNKKLHHKKIRQFLYRLQP